MFALRNPPTFWYWTDCVGMPGGRYAGELVNSIRTHPADRRITYRSFARNADLRPLRADGHPAMWRISAPDNWAISFHRSRLPTGAPVYYFAWSGIEHFFVQEPVDVDAELAAIGRGSPDFGEATKRRVAATLEDERTVDTGAIQITLVSDVGLESWCWTALEGSTVSGARAGRIVLGDTKAPDAGLAWSEEGADGKPAVYAYWVAPDLRRSGVLRGLFGVYRSVVSPHVVVCGPYSQMGRAAALSLADEVRDGLLTYPNPRGPYPLHSGNALRVRLRTEARTVILPRFLWYAFQHLQGQGLFEQMAQGLVQQCITVRDVRKIGFQLPSGQVVQLGTLAHVTSGADELEPGDILLQRVGEAKTCGTPFFVASVDPVEIDSPA